MAIVSELQEIRQLANFDAGLRFWAAGRDPLLFNDWQQGFAQIRAIFLERGDPTVPQPGPDYTALVSAKRGELMEEIHGPFWKR